MRVTFGVEDAKTICEQRYYDVSKTPSSFVFCPWQLSHHHDTHTRQRRPKGRQRRVLLCVVLLMRVCDMNHINIYHNIVTAYIMQVLRYKCVNNAEAALGDLANYFDYFKIVLA